MTEFFINFLSFLTFPFSIAIVIYLDNKIFYEPFYKGDPIKRLGGYESYQIRLFGLLFTIISVVIFFISFKNNWEKTSLTWMAAGFGVIGIKYIIHGSSFPHWLQYQ